MGNSSPVTIVFTIEEPTVAVTSVSLSQTEATLNIGETLTLTPTVLPDNATDKSVTWTTSDPAVATVTDGVVTAVAAGTATITATATNGTADDTSDDKTATCTVTVTEPTYNITLKEGTEDADKWTITPTSAKAGETVTITYNGTKKVKSVKAVVKTAAGDLSALTGDYEAQDGDVLTGTLDGSTQPYKITIADGATVTLDGVTINGVNNDNYKWAGITCAGDATIILSGTNTVKGFYNEYPGIHVPSGKTLTIQGDGSLTASSNGWGAGIGCGYKIACGNITIEGGTITATGGGNAAGIGGGAQASCGNINITGGTITATGGYYAAGIGGGRLASCGIITIANTVTSVTATKGDSAPNSIGAGYQGTCDTVTIEDGANVTQN